MSDLERPIPHSKRLRVDVDRPLAILDTPGSQVYNAILDQAMDQGLPETIEDVSQTPAPMQARVDWSMMSARTQPHINMLPSMTQFTDIPPAQAYPPTQYDLPPTQVDTQFPPTLRDTQVDLTQTQPVSDFGPYSDHYDEFFLPSIPEGVPVHHMTDTGAPVSVNSSSSVDSVFLNSYSSQPRIPRPTSVRPKVLRKKRGRYNTQKSKGSQKNMAKRPAMSGRDCAPTQLDDVEASPFDFAPVPNVLGNDGRYGEPIDDPVSQFSTQNTPNVPSPVPSKTALERFEQLQQRSRARVASKLVGEPNVIPPRRQTSLPGKVMRRKVSQNRFVSDPNLRLFQRRPVRPIRLEAPFPQFRQLRLRDVINNLHDEVNVTLEQWRQMGFSEVRKHDVIMKIPGFPLTRYRLVSSFRQDFENPRISLSSSHGNVSGTDIRGSH